MQKTQPNPPENWHEYWDDANQALSLASTARKMNAEGKKHLAEAAIDRFLERLEALEVRRDLELGIKLKRNRPPLEIECLISKIPAVVV